jgi:hypothetical protein
LHVAAIEHCSDDFTLGFDNPVEVLINAVYNG